MRKGVRCKRKSKYPFIRDMKVGDVVEWGNVEQRASIRTLMMKEGVMQGGESWGVSVERGENKKGKVVLFVERLS